MKFLLTGGTGFIGRHVLKLLLSQGDDVTLLLRDAHRLESVKRNEGYATVVTDLTPQHDWPFDASQYRLIHLAWDCLDDYSNKTHFEEQLPMHYAFIRSLIASGLKKVLVAGTCLEYGLANGSIDASAPTNPTTCYAFAKDALHRQLRFLQHDTSFDLQWARLFYTYGLGQRTNSLLGQLRQSLDRGEASFKMSSGEQLRDYLPVDEVANQIVAIARGEGDGIFNVCSGAPTSVRHLVEGWIRESGADIKLELGAYDYPKHEPLAFWGIK
jgi:nucleoside-diphosphate-sugar epimerase